MYIFSYPNRTYQKTNTDLSVNKVGEGARILSINAGTHQPAKHTHKRERVSKDLKSTSTTTNYLLVNKYYLTTSSIQVHYYQCE